MAAITGIDGDVTLGSALAEVRGWALTKTDSTPQYASSATSGWKKSLGGVRDWKGTANIYAPAGAVDVGPEIGDSVAVTLTATSGETYTGTAQIQEIVFTVEVEEPEAISATISFTGDGVLTTA